MREVEVIIKLFVWFCSSVVFTLSVHAIPMRLSAEIPPLSNTAELQLRHETINFNAACGLKCDFNAIQQYLWDGNRYTHMVQHMFRVFPEFVTLYGGVW